jgi:hypothetical protein
MIITEFEVISLYLFWGSEENHENSILDSQCLGLVLNRVPPRCEL